MPNIIYVLTNEAMPNMVKIGLTNDSVETRIAQLSSHSGVPLPFECYFAAEVNDCVKLEKTLHQLFSENRVNPKREFFKIDPEKVVLAISIGDFTEVTPGVAEFDKEEQAALEKAKARRPRLKLDALGIKPGDVLTCSRDETLTATVVDGGKVDFQGETLSLSAAALKALHSLGYKTPSASGSDYWIFDGELLDERRRRMEAEQFDETLPVNA
ncbi:T5orf172 domain-containing protein [Methylomagnum ishizawai]|uniref:T5orf172 domain-containing protein n=1 Tax=Methylomagnum ishizawai TaxID=1760988 RepID=A0A1Y6D1R2_9GAMM|nr:GIY-YIG nuclease family protein [Methylomagnum ishizawai]SMF93925.1 T5orf172 domain-containing protein [Methylomagnum ishizawai]